MPLPERRQDESRKDIIDPCMSDEAMVRDFPDAAASAEVRRIVRNRAGHEVASNSYARGIVLTLANDVIAPGRGP